MAYSPKPGGPRNLREMFHYLWNNLTEISTSIGDEGGIPPSLPGHVHDHINLLNVTSDQHHPQIHAHSTHTGIGPDDHHPQLHDITSHTDVDTVINPLKENQGLFWDVDSGTWRNRAGAYESLGTGLANGGELNIGPGINDIEVITGLGIISDSYTDPLSPSIVTGITWPQINTAITAAPSTAGSIVWFSLAATAVPAVPAEIGGVPLFVAELRQYAQPPGPTLSKQEVFLGVAVHNGLVWKEVSNPKVLNQAAETLREFVTTVSGISRIIEGGQVTTLASFMLDQAVGTVWENNRNWHVDKSDPNRETLPALSPIVFQYVDRTFTSVGAQITTIDPSQYDNGAGPVGVPGPANATTIQRVYVDPANNYWVLWGQTVYPNFLTGLANLNADSGTTIVPFILQKSILLGYVICERAKMDWDLDEAVWIPAGSNAAGSGGGGTPITDHNNLNGIGANDHHNQVHLLYGTDHSDIDTIPALAPVHVLHREAGNLNWEVDYRSKFLTYVLGPTYYDQQWVTNQEYIAIANTETTDNAFPQNVGAPVRTYPDPAPFLTAANTSQVRSGHNYTFIADGLIQRLYVWVPELTPDVRYSIVIINDPNGTPSARRIDLENASLKLDAWTTVEVGSVLYTAGAEVLVYLEAQNFGSTTQVTGGWISEGQDNVAGPALQGWNHNNAQNIVRIDKTDLDTVNRSAELLGIISGSTIQFVETAAPTNSRTYLVLATPVDQGSYIEYSVSLQSSAGIIPNGNTSTMTADIPVSQSTEFGFETDKWLNDSPTWATITSFLEYDGVPQAPSINTGYGIDVQFQELTQSPDWDLISISGGGGGGGGDFTPDLFLGAGTTGYVPDPITETGNFLRDDGSWAPGGGGSTEALIAQTAHGFTTQNVVRFNGTGYVKAQADLATTLGLGVVTEVPDVNSFKIAMSGRFNVTHGLTTDEWYYLSDSVAGALTATEPALSQPIVYVEDVDHFYVFPYRPSLNAPDTGPQVGEIKAYFGALIDLKFGWHACDGTNGTPDLAGKTIFGEGGGFTYDTSGGAVPAGNAATGDAGAHGHVVNVYGAGTHTHTGSATNGNGTSPVNIAAPANGFGGGHTHPLSITGVGDHVHSADTGGGVANHNHSIEANTLPPYHVLRYIMYTGV